MASLPAIPALIAFMDALFTSTSAVCVTGLVTVTPSAVHPAWTGDTPDPDPGGRTGGDRMCDSLFSYFTEKDYGKRKDCYPGRPITWIRRAAW